MYSSESDFLISKFGKKPVKGGMPWNFAGLSQSQKWPKIWENMYVTCFVSNPRLTSRAMYFHETLEWRVINDFTRFYHFFTFLHFFHDLNDVSWPDESPRYHCFHYPTWFLSFVVRIRVQVFQMFSITDWGRV